MLSIWYCEKDGGERCTPSSPKGGNLKHRLLTCWDFLRTRLASHMRKQSNVASHCLTWLLSSRSDQRLSCSCTHPILPAGRSSIPSEYEGSFDLRCSGTKCGGADGSIDGGRRLSSAFYACLYCAKVSCKTCIRTMWGQSEQLGHKERHQDNPKRFVCRECSSLLATKKHEMSCSECNEVQHLKQDFRQTAKFVESSSCDENVKKRIQIMTNRLCRNIDLYIGHVARDRNQSMFWPEKLQEWAREGIYDQMLILSDFWKLFEGTYERRVNCDTGDKQSVETHCIWSLCPPLEKLDSQDRMNLSQGVYNRSVTQTLNTITHIHYTLSTQMYLSVCVIKKSCSW